MVEAEFVDYSVNSSERNYVDMRSSAQPSKISRRDFFMASALVTSVYLLQGRYAAHACTLLTSLPAAFFTYKVLSEESSTLKGYRSILFYWALQGSLGLLDVLLADSFGYILAKLVLMSLAFGHAASQNKEAFDKMLEQPGSLKEDFTQCMTSIVSLYDSEGYAIQSPRSSSSIYMKSNGEESTACPIHSETMQSTQKETPEKKMKTHGVNRALTPHPDAFLEDRDLRVKKGNGDCLASQESHCTIRLAFGDLISNPLEKVVFRKPEETKVITVTNVSEKNIIWALKCNALHRLAASPACGVVPRGGEEKINVMYRQGVSVEYGDKLAIDYTLVETDILEYDPNFTNRTDKKRHLLRVSYDF